MSKDKKKKKDEESKKVKAAKKEKSVSPAAKVKAPKKAKAAAPRKKAAAQQTISSDDIALRAYFIAEARNAQGIHGSESDDWHEAERQLRKEAKKK